MSTAFIPVRCGSKSIPMKNIRVLAGRPLLHWALSASNGSGIFDRIVVATDCKEIADCARSFPSDIVEIYDRDPENALDASSTESVLLEYLGKKSLKSGELFALIQATSPFTTKEDIVAAYLHYKSGNYDSLLTCTRVKKFLWSYDGKSLNYDYRSRPRRQDFAGVLVENGAFYLTTVGSLQASGNRLSGRIGIYVMENERTFFEIDEESDWKIAEQLMLRGGV